MKTLILGVAGTGKSYLVDEMKRRGFDAVDADKGLATFVDEGGEEVEYDPEGGAEWWKSHYYVLRPGELGRLLRQSGSVYLFGDVGGQPGKENGLLESADLFDRVVYLEASADVIRDRLRAREDNPFGKNPEEVEGTMKHKIKMDEIARARHFEMVDATLPVDDIVNFIVNPDP